MQLKRFLFPVGFSRFPVHRIAAVLSVLCSAILTAALPSAAAQGSTITSTIDFTATAFTTYGSGSPPVDPVMGSVTVTYDPTVSVTNETSGIHLNYLNINLGSPISFSYNAAVSGITIGGLAFDANGYVYGIDDFIFSLSGLTDHSYYLPSANLAYTQSGLNASFNTFNVSATVAPAVVATTPIPASAVMLLTALGGLGFAGFKRKRAA